AAESLRECGVPAVVRDQDVGQGVIRHGRADHNYTVGRYGDRGETILSHPGCDKWNQRDPEQKMSVRPEHPAIDVVHRLKQMMVVMPVDPDEDETQHIAESRWNQRLQGRPCCIVRRSQLEHHDGYDDGDDSVTECFEACLAHRQSSMT